MFSWINNPEDAVVNWNDISQFYVEKYKCITHSAYDYEGKPVVYTKVPSVPIGGKGFGVEFAPITFLSIFYINTHKGKAIPHSHIMSAGKFIM